MRANWKPGRGRVQTFRRTARFSLGCEILERREMLTATPAGDANYDNQFDRDDIVLVLQAGKYQTGQPATFRHGDWNGDGVFDSADLQLALHEGNYGKGQIDPAPAPPKNVILMIGDGMGFEHVKAANLYLGEKLSFEEFPFQNEMVTSNADADVKMVDSASAGTAIATGVKVNAGVVSQQIPGDGSDLKTMLEVFSEQGKSTGLVTTGPMTDATPAVFGAHEPNREVEREVAADYFRDSRPNVLFGTDSVKAAAQAVEAGYTLVTDVATIQAVAGEEHSVDSHIFGGIADYNNLGWQDSIYDWDSMALEADETAVQLNKKPLPFAELGFPHLSQMSTAALEILGQNENGFFAMIESAQIDTQSHGAAINDWGVATFMGQAAADVITGVSVMNMETIELGRTVQAVLDWVEARDLLGETLILVTADHETGGLVVTRDNGPGKHPEVEFRSSSTDYGYFVAYEHTTANVPMYAIGRNASLFGADSEFGKQVLDNTEIYDRVLSSQTEFASQTYGVLGSGY